MSVGYDYDVWAEYFYLSHSRTDGQTDSELDTVKAGAWLLLSLV